MSVLRSQFAVNILSNSGGNALNSVLQLGLLVTLSHWLETPVYAAYLTAAAIIGICDIASDFGARLWSVREFSVAGKAVRTLRHGIACKVFYTSLAMLILSMLPLTTLQTHQFLLSAIIAATQPGTDPFLWYMRGRDRLEVEAALVLIYRFITAVVMLCGTLLGGDLTTLLLLWLVCNVLRMVVESRLTIMRPLFDADTSQQRHEPLNQIGKTIYQVFPIGASLVLTTLYHHTGVLLLGIFATDADTSLFGTGFKLVMPAGFVATSIVVSSFTPLVQAVKAGDSSVIRAVVSKKMFLLTGLLMPMCFVGVFLSIPVAKVLFDAELEGAGAVMVLLMPGFYLTCINRGVKFTLNALSMDWEDALAIMAGATCFLTVTLCSPMDSWPLRVIVGWSAGESCIFVIRILLLRWKQQHRGIPLRVISAVMVLLIAAVVAVQPSVPATEVTIKEAQLSVDIDEPVEAAMTTFVRRN